MTVKELISTYADEEVAIIICKLDTEETLLSIWKTEYSRINPDKEFTFRYMHIYDDTPIKCWTIGNNEFYIYLDI